MSELERQWDVIVVGAGPAGSAAAISCARKGLKVLMVEAKTFPRRKVCGGCLNEVSVRLLRKLIGSDHPVWASAHALSRFTLLHRGERFCFSTPAGCAMDRSLMDQALADTAVELGVIFQQKVNAVLIAGNTLQREDGANLNVPSGHLVKMSHGQESVVVAAQVVVLACGLGNRSALTNMPSLQQIATKNSRVGVEAIYQEASSQYMADTIHMVVAPEGYVGLTQIAGGRLHVAAAVNRRSLQQHGPQTLVDNILRRAGAPALASEQVVWRGTPPLTSRALRLAGERVFLVGDAAGYVEPFTGEGIRWALETGIGVADFASDACAQWSDQLIGRWEAWYRQHIVAEQRLCRQITSGLKNSAICWLAHYVLRFQPKIASKIIQRLNSG